MEHACARASVARPGLTLTLSRGSCALTFLQQMRPMKESVGKEGMHDGPKKEQRDPKIQRLLLDSVPQTAPQAGDLRIAVTFQRWRKHAASLMKKRCLG